VNTFPEAWIMGRIVVQINDELEREFRNLVAEIFGVRRGALSQAVEQAIKLWIEKMKLAKKSTLSFRSFEVKPKGEISKDLAQKLLREFRESEEKRLERRVVKL